MFFFINLIVFLRYNSEGENIVISIVSTKKGNGDRLINSAENLSAVHFSLKGKNTMEHGYYQMALKGHVGEAASAVNDVEKLRSSKISI